MVEKARLELEVDSRQAKQGVDQLDKSFDGLGKSAAEIVGRLVAIEKNLEDIGRSSRTTAQGTETAARGFSRIALNGQRTNETLDRMERNLADVIRETRQATTQNQRFERSLASTSRTGAQLRNVLGGLFAGVSGAFVLRDATRVIAGFEESLATLRGVTGLDSQSAQFEELQNQARQLGATTRFTAQQAAEGQVFLARAGFDAQQVLSALPATLSLASAGQLELGQAADIASNAVTQFNLSASETGRVADSLVNVANNANTNVAQLAEALKYAGPIANAFGLSIETTNAALGKLGDAGIQATLAGTGLRGTLAALATPSTEAAARIADLVGNLDQVDVSTRGLIPVLKSFRDANLDVIDAFDIFGRRNAGVALTLVKSVDQIQALIKVQSEGAGAAKKFADIQNDTLRGSFLALRSAVEAAYLSVGDDGYTGALRGLVDTSTVAIRILAGTADETDRANGSASLLAHSIEGIGVAIGVITTSQVVAYLGRMTAALVATNAAAAVNPFTAFAVVIGTITGAVVALSHELENFDTILNRIKSRSTNLADIVENAKLPSIVAGDEDASVERRAAAYQKLAEAREAAIVRIRSGSDAQLGQDGDVVLRDIFGINQVKSLISKEDASRLATTTLDIVRQEFIDKGGKLGDIGGFLQYITSERPIVDPDSIRASIFRTINVAGTQSRGRVNTQGLGGYIESEDALVQRGAAQVIERIVGNAAQNGISSVNDIDESALAAFGVTIGNTVRAAIEPAIVAAAESARGKASELSNPKTPGSSQAELDVVAVLKDRIAEEDKKNAALQAGAQHLSAYAVAENSLKQILDDANLSTEARLKIEQGLGAQLLQSIKDNEDLAAKIQAKAEADARAEDAARSRLSDEEKLAEFLQKQREALAIASAEETQRRTVTAVIQAQNIARDAGRLLTIGEFIEVVRLTQAQERLNQAKRDEKKAGKLDERNEKKYVEQLRRSAYDRRAASFEIQSLFRNVSDEQKYLSDALSSARSGGDPREADNIRERLDAQREITKLTLESGETNPLAIATRIKSYDSEIVKLQELRRELELAEEQQRVFDDFGRAGADALYGLVTATDSWKDSLSRLVEQLDRIAFDSFVAPLVQNGISSGLSSLFGGFSLLPSANGNAFINGQPIKWFADGGIINSPVVFPLGGAGEKGPEAIMPLKRGPDGKLGVSMVNSGNTSAQNITVNVRGGGRGRGDRRSDFGRSGRQLAQDIARSLPR